MVRVAAMHVNRGRRYRTFQEYLRAVRMTRLMLRSFLGPFAVTFPVALFILDMQFLWVYADELIGKGLDAWIILKLMVFASARLVNLALPLAVLVASIMSMGNLAERSEMTALKASGTSYLKMIRPLVLCMALISGGALWFSNRGWPAANIKFRTLLYSVTRQKPALNVREGVFYNGIEGFSIRVQTKHPDGRLEQVLIHDHRDPEGKRLLVVKAESGQMRQEQGFLVLELNHGVSYEEHQETMSRAQERVYPHVQSRFERQTLRIPLNSLDFSMANQDLFRKSYEMMTLRELAQVSDSLSFEIQDESQALGQYGQRQIRMLRDTTGWFAATATSGKSSSISPWLNALTASSKAQIFNQAREASRNQARSIASARTNEQGKVRRMHRHDIEWHRKFILSLGCMVLFFVGSSLGAMVGRGGLGMPTLLAFLLFILYYILSMTGEELVKIGVLSPAPGMWLSTMLLTPLAVLLTWASATERKLFALRG